MSHPDIGVVLENNEKYSHESQNANGTSTVETNSVVLNNTNVDKDTIEMLQNSNVNTKEADISKLSEIRNDNSEVYCDGNKNEHELCRKACPLNQEQIQNTNIENINDKSKESPLTVPDTLVQDISKLDIAENQATNKSKLGYSVVINQESDSLRNLWLYESSDEDSDYEKNWQLHMLKKKRAETFTDSESDSSESFESTDDDHETGAANGEPQDK